MLLNARKIFYEAGSQATILLGIEDVTKKRAAERELAELVRQKDIMLEEMRHRVSNSLQIIASIIMMKAKSVNSEEMRRHLQEAHQRVLSVAAVQQHLHATAAGATIQLGAYLTKLCDALSRSMIGDNRSISLKVRGEDGSASCRDAESLGLIVTELIINSLKHAFNESTRAGRRLRPAKNRPWHRHHRCACQATRCESRHVERLQRNDRIGHARHFYGEADQGRVKRGRYGAQTFVRAKVRSSNR
jgi:two-component sensor histidine kinase